MSGSYGAIFQPRDASGIGQRRRPEEERGTAVAGQQIRIPEAARHRETEQEQDNGTPTTSGITTLSTREKLVRAQSLYDDYVNSEAHKQAIAEAVAAEEKNRMDSWMTAAITGAPIGPEKPYVDPREQELKALVEHYRAQQAQEANQAVTDRNLQSLQNWSEADKRALEEHAAAIYQDFYGNINPADGVIRPVRAFQESELTRKYGRETVDAMAEALIRQWNAENPHQMEQKGREGVNNGFLSGLGHNLASIPAKAIGGLAGTMEYIRELGYRTGQYSTMDPNSAGNLLSVYAGAVQGQTAQNIQEAVPGTGGKLLSLGYQGVMTVADNYARLVLGGGAAGGAALAATGTFAQTMSDASRQGATPGQAVLLATTNAGIEAAMEKIPLDNLLGDVKAGKLGAKEIVLNAFAQAGIEITTEEASLFGSVLAEAAILQEKSGYTQQVNALLAGGATMTEARQQAARDLILEAAETAVVSGISGGVSSAGAAMVNNAVVDAANKQQNPESAANNAATGRGQNNEAATPEEVAEQLGRESPKAEPVQKTEGELGVDRAYELTVGAEQQKNADSGESTVTLRSAKTASIQQKAGTDEEAAAMPETKAISHPIESYPAEKQNSIRSYIRSVDESIKGFVQRVKRGDTTFRRQKIADVSDRAAKDIGGLLGVDANGYTHNINTGGVKHIINRHGENGEQDHSMALDDDIARVGWVLENYDRVELLTENGRQIYSKEFKDSNNNPAPQIRFIKKIDGTYYVVEAAFENKHKKLWVQSAYLQKNNGDVTQESAADPSANHETNAQSELTSPSPDNSVPQNGPEVNGNNDESRMPQVDTGRQSAEHGQGEIKGTGAAESGGFEAMGAADQNFSGKSAYNATLSEDNAQPDRAGDVRPMELPQRDINGRRVSAVTGNVYAAGITPDEFASLMEEPTARGDFSYIPITNNQATQNATEYISRLGWDDAYHQWAADVRQGMAGAAMSARGALFLNHAAQAGDRQLWLNILSDFQRLGTNTAQGLQAYQIVRQLDPSDRLYLIRRSVQQMVEDMHLRVPIEIDQDMADSYQNASTDEEADAILDEIMDDVARQIPSTIAERWTALRYVNMLGNLRTQARNISGNLGARAAYLAKDQIGALLEKAVAAVNPNFQRTKSNLVSRELRELGRADFDQIRDVLLDGGRFDDARRHDSTRFAREVNERRRIFRSGIMERYRQATNWAMNNEYFGDAAFARSAYARAFGGYLKANGFRGSTLDGIDQNLLTNARLYAIQQAQESTFRDRNMLSDWISGIGRRRGTPAAIRAISEGVMPFRRTPANVLIRAEEFSPLGIINTAVTAARAANPNSEVNGTDVVESMAKTLTGTGLFFMGMLLGSAGLLTGGPDADEDKDAFDKENGEQNYALQLPGGENVTIDWLSPIAIPMFLGAELAKVIGEGGYDLADFEKVFTSLADPLIQMSMLQGVNDTLDDLKYSQNNLGQFFINAALSYMTQGLTNTLLGQVERSTESERMTTYVDKDSAVPQWLQRQLGKASQKIPLWDYQQTPYINAKGESESQRTDALGWLYNLVSPGYISKFEVDSVAQELYRLHDAGVTEANVFPTAPGTTISYTDGNGVTHKDYNLSPEEADTLKRVTGQTAMTILGDMFQSKDYQALTDEQKAKAVTLVYDYAREKGRDAAISGYPDLSGWMSGIEGSEQDAIIRKVAGEQLADTVSDLSTAWENGWNAEDKERRLEAAYDTYTALSAEAQKEILKDAGSGVRNYVEARANGISHREYLDVFRLLEGIVPQEGYTNPRDVQEAKVISDNRTLSEAHKALLIGQMVSGAQRENLDLMMDRGYSTKDYTDVLQLYCDIYDVKGENKKERFIAALKSNFGMSDSEAKAVYDIYK